MTTRRDFIKSSSMLTAGLLASPALFNHYNKNNIGLQLYTVRDAMAKDPVATLAKVAQIGYKEVEGATYTGDEKFYGMSPVAFSKLLKQNGLVMPSSHYQLGEDKMNGKIVQGTILHDWDKAISDAKMVGLQYMVCAYLSETDRATLDDYKKIADEFNKAGETCKKAGIQLCYHNHNFEFVPQQGKVPYSILMENTDKNLVKFEMDMYWVTKAGYDPVDLINKYPGRFPLWHVKDMTKTSDHTFAAVGSGMIDFKRIFKYADKAGMKHFFVEQDKTPGDPFVSIKQSYDYIKNTLLG